MNFILIFFLRLSQSIPISYIPERGIPPSQRLYPVMDYYEASNILIIFSGLDSEGPQSDLWSYDLSTNVWEQIVPTDNRIPGNCYPVPRTSSSCFASRLSHSFYIFGGLSASGPLNDLWAYQIDNHKWTEIQTQNAPAPRSLFGYTRFDDGLHEYFAVYGGSKAAGADNHLFMYEIS